MVPSTFDDAPIGMALVALDGTWLRTNASLCQILGYGEPELLELTFQDLTQSPEIVRLIEGEVDKVNKTLSQVEGIKKVALIACMLSRMFPLPICCTNFLKNRNANCSQTMLAMRNARRSGSVTALISSASLAFTSDRWK